jgi:hypothetical protein
MDNLDGALTDYTKAIQLDPKAATAYEERGRVHGDFDRALADFDAAIRLNPKNAITYNNRGLVFRNKRQHARAIEDFDAALRLDPKYAVAYANRGLALEETNQLERALTDYRLAVSLNAELKHGGAAIKRVEQKLASATSQVETPTRPDAKSTPAFATVTSGPRVALVIGNGNYLHSERLVNPVNDATDIAQALRKLGFEVVEGHDLDKRGMEDKAREFGHKLERASLALFFYAGHGMQVAGRNYLIPVDSKLQRGGDLNLDTVDVSVILAQMEADQRVNLVFLDACRDNPLARSFARTLGARSTSVGQGLASIQSAIGTMIAYATQPDNVAFDGDGQRNSPFTSALLKHISTPGLEIAALMRRVRADVVASTRQKQVPWDHSSLIGDVILAR